MSSLFRRRGPILRARDPVAVERVELACRSTLDAEGPDPLRRLVGRWRTEGASNADIRNVAAKLDEMNVAIYRYAAAVIDAELDGREPPAMAPLAAEEQRLFRMPPEAAFAYLAEREPGLLELEAEIRERRLTASAPLLGPDGMLSHLDKRLSPQDRAEAQGVRSKYVVTKALRQELLSLVGPQAKTSDPLVRSSIAASAASRYLIMLAGLT